MTDFDQYIPKSKRKDIELVAITWVDSCQPDPTWQFLSEKKDHSPVDVVSVGWLLPGYGEGKKVLAQNFGDANRDTAQVSGVMVIPDNAILQIKTLSFGDDYAG